MSIGFMDSTAGLVEYQGLIKLNCRGGIARQRKSMGILHLAWVQISCSSACCGLWLFTVQIQIAHFNGA